MPSTTLYVRGMDEFDAARIKRAAEARGWTIAKYLGALISLHDTMRALADTPTPDGRWEQVRTELEALGLNTVSA